MPDNLGVNGTNAMVTKTKLNVPKENIEINACIEI